MAELLENNLIINLTSTKAVAKLDVKLSAYTKGMIPDVSKFMTDAPHDGVFYGRMDGEWKDITQFIDGNVVLTDEGSGLNVEKVSESTNVVKISARQWQGLLSELPNQLDSDTTYYAYDNTKADLYLNGGTAYSDEDEDFMQLFDGGTATVVHSIFLMPMNAKGEF